MNHSLKTKLHVLLLLTTVFALPMPFWIVELGFDVTKSSSGTVGMYSFMYSAWDAYHFWMHFMMFCVLATVTLQLFSLLQDNSE